jgi:hypothetical protein
MSLTYITCIGGGALKMNHILIKIINTDPNIELLQLQELYGESITGFYCKNSTKTNAVMQQELDEKLKSHEGCEKLGKYIYTIDKTTLKTYIKEITGAKTCSTLDSESKTEEKKTKKTTGTKSKAITTEKSDDEEEKPKTKPKRASKKKTEKEPDKSSSNEEVKPKEDEKTKTKTKKVVKSKSSNDPESSDSSGSDIEIQVKTPVKKTTAKSNNSTKKIVVNTDSEPESD